jgi:ribonucleoside-diphosphate reductase alpha chain
MVDHPNIKSATSLIDYIFRVLGYEYLGRTDLVHVLDAPGNTGEGDEEEEGTAPLPGRVSNSGQVAPRIPKMQAATAFQQEGGTQDYLKSMQSDAPACNTCGHITVRSGTCYKCLNCGTSMGCS